VDECKPLFSGVGGCIFRRVEATRALEGVLPDIARTVCERRGIHTPQQGETYEAWEGFVNGEH